MKRVLIVTIVTVVTELNAVDDGKNKHERTINDLTNGEIAYTLPWGLSSFRFGRLGIKSSYPINPQPCGTFSLKIERMGNLILVYKNTAKGDEKFPSSSWSPDACMPALFV